MTPPEALLAHRSDPARRAVLGDWYAERGLRQVRLGLALQITADDAVAALDAALKGTT